MTRAIDVASLERGTGKPWHDWLAHLAEIGARDLSHAEIARHLRTECGLGGWWAQSIAVAYEQHIGRRVPGQQSDGGFQVSINRTFAGSMDEVLARWQAAIKGRNELAGVSITRGPDVSRTDKWRYWRCGLADGSRVTIGIGHKNAGKSVFGVGHEKVASPREVERWRAFWKAELARL